MGQHSRPPFTGRYRAALAALAFLASALPAAAAEVVALGASQTYGKGVARGEDYPSRLQFCCGSRGSR